MRLDLKVLHHTEGPAELLTMKGTLIALLKSSQLKKKKSMKWPLFLHIALILLTYSIDL